MNLTDSHTDVAGRSGRSTTSIFIWAMNKAVYDGLPDDLKAVIDANSGLMASGMGGPGA